MLLISDPSIEGSNQTSVRTSCWPWRRRRAADAANGTSDDEDEAPRGTKKAAFALAVGVGYLSDPPELQGCAHYVEHMLFMGTKKFPKENGWSTFLSRHGGVDNGETFAESTVFYFDLVPEQLQAGLERFGSFFSSPLFKWGSSAREARQIDSGLSRPRRTTRAARTALGPPDHSSAPAAASGGATRRASSTTRSGRRWTRAVS